MQNGEELQRSYYEHSSSTYDNIHSYHYDKSHQIAFQFLSSMISHLKCQSVLDIGAGTGNLLLLLKNEFQNIQITGIEPVESLILEGYKKGLSKKELFPGNAYNLEFENDSVDVVTAFGVLHHVKNPHIVVSEMLRVAKKAIFISDANNFGQGNFLKRTIKQVINFFGLWRTIDFILTKGKGYHYSEGDGIFYSYSVFNNFIQIQKQCKFVHILNTSNSNKSIYRSAKHVAVIGLK